MDKLKKLELNSHVKDKEGVSNTKVNTLVIPKCSIKTSLEVPGRYPDSVMSFERSGSVNSINKGMQTITISRPACKHPMYRSKNYNYLKCKTTVNKEHEVEQVEKQTNEEEQHGEKEKKIKKVVRTKDATLSGA